MSERAQPFFFRPRDSRLHVVPARRFFYKRNVATRDAAMDVAHADDDGPEDSPKKRKKKKGAMELDTDEL